MEPSGNEELDGLLDLVALTKRKFFKEFYLLVAVGYYLFFEFDTAPTRRVRPRFDVEEAYRMHRTIDHDLFKRRYRISDRRFQLIYDTLKWPWEMDHALRQGPHPAVKMLAALRQLVDGSSPFQVSDTYKLSETVAAVSLERFCTDVIENFSSYLKPDWERSLASSKARGYDGYLGSLDCTHIGWHACPRAYNQAHKDRTGHVSLILEAVVDSDLRIIHHYFGMPGGANDLNVLHGSPLLNLIEQDQYPNYEYSLGGETFTQPYILVDGIYPRWKLFARTIANARGEEEHYRRWQEAVRKDVERCFGILKKVFECLSRNSKKRNKELIAKIVTTCLILHNMRVEDKEIHQDDELRLDNLYEVTIPARLRVQTNYLIAQDATMRAAGRRRLRELENKQEHVRLQKALVAWCASKFGG